MERIVTPGERSVALEPSSRYHSPLLSAYADTEFVGPANFRFRDSGIPESSISNGTTF